jgi:hypothetical protein
VSLLQHYSRELCGIGSRSWELRKEPHHCYEQRWDCQQRGDLDWRLYFGREPKGIRMIPCHRSRKALSCFSFYTRTPGVWQELFLDFFSSICIVQSQNDLLGVVPRPIIPVFGKQSGHLQQHIPVQAKAMTSVEKQSAHLHVEQI